MIFDFEKGETLLIDKPLGWTSFDVVNHLRLVIKKNLHIKKLKVGHAGTLDPLATGLLVVCTGKLTKQIQTFQDQDKTYTGTMLLGQTTPSYDGETQPDAYFPFEHLLPEQLDDARKKLTGTIAQLPPVFSAIKIDGKRAFNYARKNQEVRIEPRMVTINAFNFDAVQLPEIKFIVNCTKGTYIRSLVHDFGKLLDNGASLIELRRTKIGDLSIDDAWSLTNLKAAILRDISPE